MKKIIICIILSTLFLVGCETQNEKDFRKEIENFPKTKNLKIIKEKLEYFKKNNPNSELIKKAEVLIENEFNNQFKEIKKSFENSDLSLGYKKITELERNFADFTNLKEEIKKLQPDKKYIELMNKEEIIYYQIDNFIKEFPEYDKEKIDRLKEKFLTLSEKEYEKLEKMEYSEEALFFFNFEREVKGFKAIYPDFDKEKINKLENKVKIFEKKHKEKIEKERKEEVNRRKNKQIKIKKALSKLSKNYDYNKDITWVNNGSYDNIKVYGGYNGKKYNGGIWYRMKFKYSGNSWIFFEKAFVIIDGVSYPFWFNLNEQETDIYDSCCEYYDIPFDPLDDVMIEYMIKSKNVSIEFVGQKRRTYKLTRRDRKKLKAILELMDAERNY